MFVCVCVCVCVCGVCVCACVCGVCVFVVCGCVCVGVCLWCVGVCVCVGVGVFVGVCVCVWVGGCVIILGGMGTSRFKLNVTFKLHLGRRSIIHSVNRFVCQAVYRSVDMLLVSALL